ncbi:MAG TPA: T9SS type A sorting domain-containing protein [Ignavibacteriaceae bacterium]|nr:T9SS type A sorting domain-containing protein [Ignavibacteriaceae bacterium]
MKKVFLLFCLILVTGTFLQAQTTDVTFKVDMKIRIVTGSFHPGTDTVRVRGSFDGWGSGVDMTDGDNDSVYTATITSQPQNTAIFYKFFYTPSSWESDPNREMNTGTNATVVLDPYFFDSRSPYTKDSTSVTFNVDMQLPAQSAFHPSTDHVFVAGNFTGWGGGAIEMQDLDGDSIYTVTVDSLTSGNLLIYKFIYSATTAANGTWESPQEGDDYFLPDRNRIAGISDTGNVLSRYWNNTNPNVTTGNGNIFFEVDMSVLHEFGVFDPNVDSVQVRGSFNGWNDSEPPRSLLNQDPGNPDHWFLDVPFVNEVLNNKMHYKFYIKNGTGSTPYSNTGWEVSLDPSDAGNRDRPITFEGIDDQEAGLQYFDGIEPDWVIPQGTSVDCQFSVDMTYATLADSQGTRPLFNPATDSVFWLPQLPLYYAVHHYSWPGGYPRVLQLTDPDQDMIYTGTLTIAGPDFNGFLYNYAFSKNGTLTQEAGTQMDMRVRFLPQSGPRTFPASYIMPQDIWSNTAKPEESGPTVGVKDKGLLAITYKLSQNYPNPFNPSTKITFSIPEAGLVSLKVFNILGEEVATLLNNEMKTGVYEVDFNAANLSSGIYFYTIKANSFTATKKMMLIK